MIRQVADQSMGGMGNIVKAGDKVLIKINTVIPVPANAGFTTDPRMLEALIELVQEQNPARIQIGGRGVHEALAAAANCPGVTGLDMPSIDANLLPELYDSGKPIVIAEQNNGYIWQNLLKGIWRHRGNHAARSRIVAVNTLTADGRPQFIHSATYEELIDVFGLSAPKLAERLSQLQGEM